MFLRFIEGAGCKMVHRGRLLMRKKLWRAPKDGGWRRMVGDG